MKLLLTSPSVRFWKLEKSDTNLRHLIEPTADVPDVVRKIFRLVAGQVPRISGNMNAKDATQIRTAVSRLHASPMAHEVRSLLPTVDLNN